MKNWDPTSCCVYKFVVITGQLKKNKVMASDAESNGLVQGWATPVLEGRCPACLRCFPSTTHLIQMNRSPSACDPGLHKTVNHPFI